MTEKDKDLVRAIYDQVAETAKLGERARILRMISTIVASSKSGKETDGVLVELALEIAKEGS